MSEADGSGSTPLPKFAFVKYDPSFGIDTEVVKVKHIRVQEDHKNAACRRPFKPRNNLDFKQDMWYVVRTKKRTKDSKEKNFWALIGRLHESEVGLIDSLNEAGRGKRVSFPPLDAPETEPESTDAEPRIRNSIVNEAREVRLTKKRRKHDSEVKDMETYVRKSAPSNVALGDSPDSDQETVDMNNITMDEYVDNSALPNDSHEERANSSNVTAQSIDKDTGANRNSSFTSETSLQSSILDLMNMIQGLKEEVRDIKSIREEFKDMKKQVEDCSSKVDKMAENISKCENKAYFIQNWINNVSKSEENSQVFSY